MEDIVTNEFNIPADKEINLILTYKDCETLMKCISASDSLFKIAVKASIGASKKKILDIIENISIVSSKLESKLIQIEDELSDNND